MSRQISLCCISKGEPGLRRMLDSALPLVQDIVIACDPADEAAVRKHLTPPLSIEPRIIARPFDGFGPQRNASFAAAKYDWCFWADSDDELVGAAELRKWLDARDDSPHQFFMEYRYAKNLTQTRERIVYRPRGDWRDFEVHELWLADEGRMLASDTVPDDVAHVLHHYRADKPADVEARAARNRRLLEAHIKRRNAAGQPPDRRLLGHYISQLIVEGELDFADGLLKAFIVDEPPGAARSRAWRERADIAFQKADYDLARQFALQAVGETPASVEARLALIDACCGLGRWDEAWHWYESAYHKGLNLHGDPLGYDPMLLKPQWALAAKILFELERFEQALAAIRQIPDAERGDDVWAFISKLEKELDNEKAAEAFEHICSVREYDHFRELRPDDDYRRRLAALMPKGAQDYPAVAKWLLPAVPADRPSVAIHCGMECNGMYEAWGPELLERGLGGSEEAAIRLAAELAKAGCHVEMYGPWTREGLVDGVHYIYHAKWNKARRLDVFVAWRYEQLADLAPECGARWLWNHDMILPGMHVRPREHGIDAMLCLTEYHASETAAVIEDDCPPILVTRNGLPPMPEVPVSKVPGRVVYASSPDRGLLQLLRMWPDVIKDVPGATLHVYYGFTKGWMKAEARNKSKKVERLLLEKLLAETPGVTFFGMVGKAELYRAFAEASVWAYPSTWYETSCITAMQAQALGARPVTTDLAALAETVEWGDVLPTMPHIFNEVEHRERYTKMLVDALRLPDPTHDWRPELARRWDWAGVAAQWKGWMDDLRSDPGRDHGTLAGAYAGPGRDGGRGDDGSGSALGGADAGGSGEPAGEPCAVGQPAAAGAGRCPAPDSGGPEGHR